MKKLKNSLPLLLILSLIITATVNLNPVYAGPTALYVEFPNGTSSSIDEYYLTDTFTVEINVTGAVNLFGFDFTLKYDPAVLTAAPSVTIGDFFGSEYIIWYEEVNNDLGYVWYAVSQDTYEEAVNGSGTLATIDFTVQSPPSATNLDLCDTKLSDSNANPLSHEVFDGIFSNVGAPPIALFTYEPATPVVGESVMFDASVSVSTSPILSYVWTFGDGTSGVGVTTSHAYGMEGDYTVTLTITDSASNTDTASHTIGVIPLTYEADLIRKSAWPEHHHYVISKDENNYQTLYGKVANSKYKTDPTNAKVVFTVYDADGNELILSPFETAEVLLNPGDIANLSYDLDVTTQLPGPGKYYVEARCIYDGREGTKTKVFSFAVIL